jgi:hypothetical protein
MRALLRKSWAIPKYHPSPRFILKQKPYILIPIHNFFTLKKGKEQKYIQKLSFSFLHLTVFQNRVHNNVYIETRSTKCQTHQCLMLHYEHAVAISLTD